MVRLRHTYCLYTLLLLLLPVMVTAQTSLNVDDRKDAKDLLGSGEVISLPNAVKTSSTITVCEPVNTPASIIW